MNARWIPTVEKIMKDLGGSEAKTSCSNGKGKSIKFNGNCHIGQMMTLEKVIYHCWSMYLVCIRYASKMGKPVSTYWHDA